MEYIYSTDNSDTWTGLKTTSIYQKSNFSGYNCTLVKRNPWIEIVLNNVTVEEMHKYNLTSFCQPARDL